MYSCVNVKVILQPLSLLSFVVVVVVVIVIVVTPIMTDSLKSLYHIDCSMIFYYRLFCIVSWLGKWPSSCSFLRDAHETGEHTTEHMSQFQN